MTTVQTEELVEYTATVRMGVSGSPYIEVHRQAAAGGVDLVPLEYSHRRIVDLLAKSYEISDPDGLITCHCGALMDYGQHECDACSGDAANRRDECAMYSELREGL